MSRNPTLCYFVSFYIVRVRHFIEMPEFLRELTIFKMSFISSFDIINVVPDQEAQDPNIL